MAKAGLHFSMQEFKVNKKPISYQVTQVESGRQFGYFAEEDISYNMRKCKNKKPTDKNKGPKVTKATNVNQRQLTTQEHYEDTMLVIPIPVRNHVLLVIRCR